MPFDFFFSQHVFQIMDTIKGTMTEIYNDLSKSTSGNTIAEVSHIQMGDSCFIIRVTGEYNCSVFCATDSTTEDRD